MTEPAGLTERLARVEIAADKNAARLNEHERELYGDQRRGDQGLVFALRENTAMQRERYEADERWRRRQASLIWFSVILAIGSMIVSSLSLSVAIAAVQTLSQLAGM